MLKKGEEKTKVKNLDMGMVKKLLLWRDKRNEQLAATKHTCTLRPKENSGPCISCGYYKKCHHHRWEREYIHKQENAQKDCKIRNKKIGNKEQEESILESHVDKDYDYPCQPMDFACPDRETCEKGQFCPWN